MLCLQLFNMYIVYITINIYFKFKCLNLRTYRIQHLLLHCLTVFHFCPLKQVKCDQYWPIRGTETYGMIQVTMLDAVELATYSVRTFALYKVKSCLPFPLIIVSFNIFSHLTSLLPLCSNRMALARNARSGSSSSWPGQTTECLNTPPPS